MNYKPVDLNTINNGAATELFQEEFEKVMRNINDLSVDSLAPREVSLKFRIKPSKDRQSAITTIQASSKLISVAEHESAILITPKGAYSANAKQIDMFENEENQK